MYPNYKGPRTIGGLPDKRTVEWKDYVAKNLAQDETSSMTSSKPEISSVSKVSVSKAVESKSSAEESKTQYPGFVGKMTANNLPDKRTKEWRDYNAARE